MSDERRFLEGIHEIEVADEAAPRIRGPVPKESVEHPTRHDDVVVNKEDVGFYLGHPTRDQINAIPFRRSRGHFEGRDVVEADVGMQGSCEAVVGVVSDAEVVELNLRLGSEPIGDSVSHLGVTDGQ